MSLKPKHPRLLSYVNGHFLHMLFRFELANSVETSRYNPIQSPCFSSSCTSLPSFIFVFQVCHKSLYKHAPFHYRAVFVKPLFLLKLSAETLLCTLWSGQACVGRRIVYSWKSSHSTIFCKLLSHVPCWLVVQISHLHFSKKMTANIYKNVNVQSSTFTKM